LGFKSSTEFPHSALSRFPTFQQNNVHTVVESALIPEYNFKSSAFRFYLP
jgi:hypothetical protein